MASSGGSGIIAPRHPVPSMRAAFEESVAEADAGLESNGNSSSSLSTGTGGRQIGGPKHHWIKKLVAQIAFGLYLLHDGLAKSDGAVVRILQGHINDMDQFLSNTTTMLDASTDDISRRLQNLQVPLDEFGAISDTFEKMLESREFSKEIMEKNEKLEIVERQTTAALQTTITDLREGLVAVDELAKYLVDLKEGWRKLNLLKAARLAEKLSQLQAVTGEIEKRVANAARRMPFKPSKSPRHSAFIPNLSTTFSAKPAKFSPQSPRSPYASSTPTTPTSAHISHRLSMAPKLLDKPLPEPPKPTTINASIDIYIPQRSSSVAASHNPHPSPSHRTHHQKDRRGEVKDRDKEREKDKHKPDGKDQDKKEKRDKHDKHDKHDTPRRTLSKRRSKSVPQISGPLAGSGPSANQMLGMPPVPTIPAMPGPPPAIPLPIPPIPTAQEEGKQKAGIGSLRRTVSQKFKQSFRPSKSMGELRKKVGHVRSGSGDVEVGFMTVGEKNKEDKKARQSEEKSKTRQSEEKTKGAGNGTIRKSEDRKPGYGEEKGKTKDMALALTLEASGASMSPKPLQSPRGELQTVQEVESDKGLTQTISPQSFSPIKKRRGTLLRRVSTLVLRRKNTKDDMIMPTQRLGTANTD